MYYRKIRYVNCKKKGSGRNDKLKNHRQCVALSLYQKLIMLWNWNRRRADFLEYPKRKTPVVMTGAFFLWISI